MIQFGINCRKATVIILGVLLFPFGCSPTIADEKVVKTNRQEILSRPNIVIVFADDQGYGDLGCFGAKGFKTPNIDRLAQQGMKLTDFYVAQAVCGASRAALMTGCYPNRIGILGAPSHATRFGISDQEMTLAELVKQKGYKTAVYGKWHLGHQKKFLPLQHGFDEYYGLPYSNDMWPYHPTSKAFPDLPLIEQNSVINPAVSPEDQKKLTQDYTDRAVGFIQRNKDNPFLLYVAHAMPHVPLFGSERFAGSSSQGRYGDVIQEIDWGVGEIMKALDENGIAKNTLVIYTSDNGPWLSYGNHAGSAGPLREGKGTAWEGGMREPCVIRWPAVIPAGTTCSELAATIDIVPTVAEIIGAELPQHKIDGKSVLPLLKGDPQAKSPHEAYFYFYNRGLRAVRSGQWKLVFPHSYRSLNGPAGTDGRPSQYKQLQCGLELYHLKKDIGESLDVAGENPEVVKRLQSLADGIRRELGDQLRNQKGSQNRNPGKI
ncbi:sulfatase [Pirellulaceae bacterium]|nr:sulfatase [Pirellulaceae bacterium]